MVVFLLDTHVVSELTRPRPNRHVVDWLFGVDDDSLHLSVLTIGEIRKGVELLTDSAKKRELRQWLEETLPEWFGDRLLAITADVADTWGSLLAEVGRPVAAIDSLLAATALCHELVLVTRNEDDFPYPRLSVVNPWT